jgi:predicted RNase H-like HicB family nuclease
MRLVTRRVARSPIPGICRGNCSLHEGTGYHQVVGAGWLVSKDNSRKSPSIQAPDEARPCDFARASKRRSSCGYFEQRFETSGAETVNYVVVYERSQTGWAAYVPDLPGVVTTGRSKEEVRTLIQEAIGFHLDGLREDRLPIPEPSAEAEVISVSR